MESQTYIKNLRISPKKLRFLMNDIKRMKPFEALKALYYSNEKAGFIFYKALKSAITNAKSSLKSSDELLLFKALMVEEGQDFRRFRAGGRGGVKPFKRRTAHIRIVLTAETSPTDALSKKETVDQKKKLSVKKPIKSAGKEK